MPTLMSTSDARLLNKENSEKIERYKRVIEALSEKAKFGSQGEVQIDFSSLPPQFIDTDLLTSLERSVNERNEMIKKFNVSIPLHYRSSAIVKYDGECLGTSKVENHWYGWEVWLNSCETNTLIKLLYAGASIGELCAALPVCAIGAPIAGLSALTLDGLHSACGGDGLYFFIPAGAPLPKCQ